MESELLIELEKLKEIITNSKEYKELEEVDAEIQKGKQHVLYILYDQTFLKTDCF